MQDLHLPQNKKTNRRNVMKRKVYVDKMAPLLGLKSVG
ncbi:hypothetical protein LEP1GSC120_2689 [Leptospira santarosai str. 200702252]|nr:hypothetical protein LEP1GSC130_1489 [Leptospira santarosai str. 200403458]EMP00114.1 hypothetical protein LEP1GSC120_2689 [Leptospira santarosai str. 200702252]